MSRTGKADVKAQGRDETRRGMAGHEWGDREWMEGRGAADLLSGPLSIYSMDPLVWRCVPEEGERPLNAVELAPHLEAHLERTGFTHVEFAPSSSVAGLDAPEGVTLAPPVPGSAEDFRRLVDRLHRIGKGVVVSLRLPEPPVDEAPATRDMYSSRVLNAVLGWFDEYHADVVDLRLPETVAARLAGPSGADDTEDKGGGGRGYVAGVIKRLNEEVYARFPGAQMMLTFEGPPERHAGVTGITRPVYAGGLGFGLVRSERWGFDTVKYFSLDPLYRKYDHDLITMSSWYAFSENYVLPLGSATARGTVLDAMSGDEWQKKADLKVLFAFLFAHPGKKLIEMGAELGAGGGAPAASLPWHLLDTAYHGEIIRWVGDLGKLYLSEPALYSNDFDISGFEWIDFHDRENSVISFLRRPGDHGGAGRPPVIVVFNFTPVVRENYRLGVPMPGVWEEVLNSDASIYGGSGRGNFGLVEASPVGAHGRPWSVSLLLPPMAAVFLRAGGEG